MDMMARIKEDYAVDYNKNVERLMEVPPDGVVDPKGGVAPVWVTSTSL